MASYSNKNLKEVLCAFTFHPTESHSWDSSYFGDYFSRIQSNGFTEKKDRKGYQLQISTSLSDLLNPTVPKVQELETQMLYRTKDGKNAIILGDKALSFHKMNSYEGWQQFRDSVITPNFEKYTELGLSTAIQSCKYIYLNQFIFDENVDLREYFNIVPSLNIDASQEKSTIVESRFQRSNNLIILIRLVANQIIDKKRIVNLECGAYGVITDVNSKRTYLQTAEDMHQPISEYFEASIKEPLRKLL